MLTALMLGSCGQAEDNAAAAVKKADKAAESSSMQESESGKSEVFHGVLIDEDCSDFEDPPLHETECMFMEECRASGYGIDIKQADGEWVFYEFDDKGKELAWEYLNQTSKPDGLYISVTGELKGNIIEVKELKEEKE